MALDVDDHLFVAPEMATRIAMVRVCEISTEHRLLSPVYQLTNAVRAAEHTSVGVHAHDDHVLDSAPLQKCQKFVAVVRHCVDRSNLDGFNLMRPRIGRPARRARLAGLAGAGSVVRRRGRPPLA